MLLNKSNTCSSVTNCRFLLLPPFSAPLTSALAFGGNEEKKMPVVKHVSSHSRVIAHIDMDCFYVQVEQRKQPNLRGLPTAVVQYNSWKGGTLIAVSYEARKCGVKRSMRGEDAKQVCPEIQLVQVPVLRGKADLNTYRNAGSEVVSILARSAQCERASIDEVYLDLTDAAEAMLGETPLQRLESIDDEALKSHILGLNKDGANIKQTVKEWFSRNNADHRDKLLACGALIVAELRMKVLKETEFTCSAGIAHNKMLAKVTSGMNKPAQQTVVPFSSVKDLLNSLPIKKMKQLGGKLGSSLQNELGISTVGDLLQFSEERLQECYGINTGTWLWNISRGICGEEVQERLLPKSHSSGKTFPGPSSLKSISSVQQRLNDLCEELCERLHSDLDQNKRIAHTLTLHANAYMSAGRDSHRKFPSKSCPLRYGIAKIQEDALNLFQCALREYLGSNKVTTQGTKCRKWGVTALYVSASKIVATPTGICSITKYFNCQRENFIQDAAIPSLHLGGGPVIQRNLSKQNAGLVEEETDLGILMPGVDQLEHEGILSKNVDPTCSPLNLPLGHLNEESLLPTPSESLEMTESEQHCESPDHAKCSLFSLENQKLSKNASEVKEKKASILGYFRRCSASPIPNKDKSAPVLDTAPSSSYSGFERGSESGWHYKKDEIDESVIDELPSEIQHELRAWLRPPKRPKPPPIGIARYFLPATTHP